MAEQRSHISLSTICAGVYAAVGVLAWKINLEVVVLAAIITVVAGMLPNIDSGPGSDSGKKLVGFLTAISPLIVLSIFPAFKTGGMARIALVIIASFLIVQKLSTWILKKCFQHRGIFHSVPAAIIVFEIFYLIFFDLPPRNKLFLGGAALVGFCSHLILDATTNIDLVGNKQKKTPVLKLAGTTWPATLGMYATAALLGWFVIKDLSPGLKVYGGVAY